MAKAIARVTLTDPDRDKSYVFRLNPERIDQDSPFRVNIQHTADGWYVDCHGPAIGQLTISGTTGKGYGEEYERLRDLVENWQARVKGGERPALLQFHDWRKGEHLQVAVRNLKASQSASAPLLWRYELVMAVVGSDVAKRLAASALEGLNDAPEGGFLDA